MLKPSIDYQEGLEFTPFPIESKQYKQALCNWKNLKSQGKKKIQPLINRLTNPSLSSKHATLPKGDQSLTKN